MRGRAQNTSPHKPVELELELESSQWNQPMVKGPESDPWDPGPPHGRASFHSALPLPCSQDAVRQIPWVTRVFELEGTLKCPTQDCFKLCSPEQRIFSLFFRSSLWTYYVPRPGPEAASRAAPQGRRNNETNLPSPPHYLTVLYLELQLRFILKESLKSF